MKDDNNDNTNEQIDISKYKNTLNEIEKIESQFDEIVFEEKILKINFF